ncbi:hypothetical protein CALVIDRAFT_322798 [Calocera viscosa TUFC12733]|uniref:Uncharacterized protein n=1 Tax=Calocera viscosa (strain TUFC12733) TaxID=1330018 RepID=A0A167QPP6_CALVF|nr:hypothetical protein CALVIDRAFT_322798 [Calocera viscosa TUFC12733]
MRVLLSLTAAVSLCAKTATRYVAFRQDILRHLRFLKRQKNIFACRHLATSPDPQGRSWRLAFHKGPKMNSREVIGDAHVGGALPVRQLSSLVGRTQSSTSSLSTIIIYHLMTTPSFSRLQLAAALIEYDNDADDPEGPYRTARESAIFAHTRRTTSRPQMDADGQNSFRRSKADFLKVKLPSEMDAASERRSLASGRETPAQAQDEEVDLAEWGLAKKDERDEDEDEADDTFREPERRRAVSEFMPGPSAPTRADRRISVAQSEVVPSSSAFQHNRARRSSLGDFGAGGAFLDAAPSRRSFTDPMSQRRNSLAVLEEDLRNPFSPVDGPAAVPFPSTESPRQAEDNNPFALPPPSPSKSSRFDPKAHGRTLSTASMGSRVMLDDPRSSRYIQDDARSSRYGLDDGRSSRYFPAEDGRSIMGQSVYLQEDDERSRRLSGYNVLRPKVLVMPSPLQDEQNAAPLSPGRGGFVHSKDGPPLPPGAKVERPGPRPLSSMTLSKSYDPSNAQSMHLNPRQSLTLSQLTFRNSLMNDVSYMDMGLRRAVLDGEKVTVEMEEEEMEPVLRGDKAPGALYGRSLIDDLEARKAALRGRQRVFVGDDRPAMMDRGQPKRSSTFIDPASFESKRPPLARKGTNTSIATGRGGGAPLLSFEGEDTLTSPIDPSGSRMTKSQSTFGVDQIWEKELAKLKLIEQQEQVAAEEQRKRDEEKEARRRKKGKGKTGPEQTPLPQSPAEQSPSIRQVASPVPSLPYHLNPGRGLPNEAHRRESVATLGVNNWFNSDDDEEEESEAEKAELLTPKKTRRGYQPTPSTLPPSLPSLGHQVDDSSEDEDIPLAARMQKLAVTGLPARAGSDSEEEEMPLAAVLAKKQMQRSVSSKPGSLVSNQQGSGSFPKSASFPTPTKTTALPDFNFSGISGGLADSLGLGNVDDSNTTPTKGPATAVTGTRGPANDSDDDNVPLGLRHPGAAFSMPNLNVGTDDDEAPLGMRFPQAAMQQQAQTQALQQQQYMQMVMQQQQMMWQAEAQMRNSMAFPTGASVMGMPGALAPQMTGFGMPFGLGIPGPPGPPSVSDPGKFTRVDRWRRDVSTVDP